MKTVKNIKNSRKAAFTLAELVVVMALVLLIGGVVATFVLFMNNYSAKNERLAQQAQELAIIREETDKWFSYADGEGADIVLSGNDGGVLASAGGMVLSCTREEGGCRFEFFYKNDDQKNSVRTFGNAYTLKIYAQESGNSGDSSALLRFTVRTAVSGGVYVCEVS